MTDEPKPRRHRPARRRWLVTGASVDGKRKIRSRELEAATRESAERQFTRLTGLEVGSSEEVKDEPVVQQRSD